MYLEFECLVFEPQLYWTSLVFKWGRFVSGCQMVRYSNGGLKTGLKKPDYGPKCSVFEWSAKSCDFTIWIPDTHTIQYSGVRDSDGNCNVILKQPQNCLLIWDRMDLNTKLVQYSKAGNKSGLQKFQFSNGIWIPDHYVRSLGHHI